MKPKVLITIDTYAIGGPGKLILQFLKHGGGESCSPIVAGFWRGPKGKWQFRNAVEALGARFEVLPQDSAFDPMVIKHAYVLARANGIEILESHGYKSHVVCLALKKILKIPWVAYVHGWTRENLKVELYNQLEKNLLRFADKVVPVSRDLGMKLNLGKHAKEKLVYIPNAADLVESHPGNDMRLQLGVGEDELLFAVVGRLSPEKGHRYLIQALNTLSETCCNVKTVIVGDGQERESIAASVNKHGLADSIMMVGYQDDVAPYYQACDALVMPSLSEGMPMVALEAMMFGKPVVATKVGGIPEVVQDGVTGLLVEPANPQALAEGLTKIISNREQMASMGCRGRSRVETDFDPRTRLAKITELYRCLGAS